MQKSFKQKIMTAQRNEIKRSTLESKNDQNQNLIKISNYQNLSVLYTNPDSLVNKIKLLLN